MSKPLLSWSIHIRPSLIAKGEFGVFLVRPLKKGQRLALFIHPEDYKSLIKWKTIKSCDKIIKKAIKDFCLGTPDGFIPPTNNNFDTLIPIECLNHSCAPNLGIDQQGYFFALRDIKAGEEVVYDYGFAESNPAFKIQCACGSPVCRKIITGNDWKNPRFRAKNLKNMIPKLRKL